jgi:hypothetical protein
VKGLNLSEELWESLDTAALSEGRSRSNMAARLLADGLAGRDGKQAGSHSASSRPASSYVGAPVEPRPGRSDQEGAVAGVASGGIEDASPAVTVQVGGAKPWAGPDPRKKP